jgi:hypothetical protein
LLFLHPAFHVYND